MSGFGDTIFALSSGALPSGVAVLRISGSQAFAAAERLVGTLPHPRQAALRSIRSRNGDLIDQGLVLIFPSPHSFTGEDCVELQLHGSRAVVAAVYHELESAGCRQAEAGEFSRRAFQRGKLDLVEVEGLADLLTAETEMQRKLAISESSGEQSRVYQGWRQRILHIRAMLEAELDFSDEEDVPGSASASVLLDIAVLRQEMEAHLSLAKTGEIIRNGFKVVIAGPPNAGKSSLLNALAGSDLAIVTDIPGTTRDVLHVDLDLGGYLVRVFDTAGLRDASDTVERIGIQRAYDRIRDSDLLLLLSDSQSPSSIETIDVEVDTPVLKVGTKSDISPDGLRSGFDLMISTRSGAGLGALKERILNHIQAQTNLIQEAVPSRLRHAGHIRDAISALRSAETWSIAEAELLAEQLRLASDALGRISGRIDTEEILGVIFSSFCIGK